MEYRWVEIAKRLEAIAQAGLTYTHSDYDRERYEEIREIGRTILQDCTDLPAEAIRGLFSAEIGYPTPKVDVRAVILRDNGILMVREKLDGRWALPGGWADIGYSAGEVAVKEVREEAGLEVKPVRLLALLDKRHHDHPPSILHVYKVFILCEETGGELLPGMETSQAAFFEEENLPELSLERNTAEQLSNMFRLAGSVDLPPLLD